ncbi:hypothetical protein N332_07115, partial [Mesitornis unicolor]
GPPLLLRLFFDAEISRLSRRLQAELRILGGPRVAGVDFLVAVEGLFVPEMFPADGALVAEVLPAIGAGQGAVAFPRVELLVKDEADLQAEALLALRTSVGSLHHVVHLVPDQTVLE